MKYEVIYDYLLENPDATITLVAEVPDLRNAKAALLAGLRRVALSRNPDTDDVPTFRCSITDGKLVVGRAPPTNRINFEVVAVS